MMTTISSLLALPIPGESFLLQRHNKNILVDGGYNAHALSTALQSKAVNVDQLDIVVCTHADRDHAGGLVDLLDKSSIKVKEFWLPGAWIDGLPTLLNNPKSVVDALAIELEHHIADTVFSNDDSYESFEEQQFYRIAQMKIEQRDAARDWLRVVGHDDEVEYPGMQWLQQLTESEDQEVAVDIDTNVFRNKCRTFRRKGDRLQWHSHWVRLGIETIKTAERIRNIALQALRHGVPVRWFDFQTFAIARHASGGVVGVLEPINAVEVVPLHNIPAVAAWFAYLTPINEESLVFKSPGNDDNCFSRCDILFTADSPLGDGVGYQNSFLQPTNNECRFAIVTAPHHGSESNAIAYEHVENVYQVLLWLRAGGDSRHPGKTFKGLQPEFRACTHCPKVGNTRQFAEVMIGQSPWPLLRVNSRYCGCGW
jgi:hypothetical protein